MQEDLLAVIRWPKLHRMFGGDISRSTIDRWEKDKRFPARIHIGKNSVAWNLQAVKNWFESRPNTTQEV